MDRYEVIPSKTWVHSSGRKASIYGACPWTSETDRPNWQVVSDGFTIRDNRTNTVGMGRPPFKTAEEARVQINEWAAVYGAKTL